MKPQRILSFSDIDKDLESRWTDTVLGQQDRLDISALPQWLRCAARAKGRIDDLHVVTGEGGLLPFYCSQTRMLGLNLKRLDLGGNLHAYHQEIPSQNDPQNLLQTLFQQGPAWDVFHASALNTDGSTAQALEQIAKQTGAVVMTYPAEQSPHIPVQDRNWEEQLGGYSHNFRYNLKRHRKRLLQKEGAHEEWLNGAEDVPRLLAIILEVEQHSWKTQDDMAVLKGSHEHRLLEALLPYLAERGWLQANVLYRQGSPIAYSLCYRWGGRMGQMKTSFDNRLRKLNPGSVAVETSIQRAFDLGLADYDFLGDQMPHKAHWSKQVRSHTHYYVFAPSMKGQLVGRAKQALRRIRP